MVVFFGKDESEMPHRPEKHLQTITLLGVPPSWWNTYSVVTSSGLLTLYLEALMLKVDSYEYMTFYQSSAMTFLYSRPNMIVLVFIFFIRSGFMAATPPACSGASAGWAALSTWRTTAILPHLFAAQQRSSLGISRPVLTGYLSGSCLLSDSSRALSVERCDKLGKYLVQVTRQLIDGLYLPSGSGISSNETPSPSKQEDTFSLPFSMSHVGFQYIFLKALDIYGKMCL